MHLYNICLPPWYVEEVVGSNPLCYNSNTIGLCSVEVSRVGRVSLLVFLWSGAANAEYNEGSSLAGYNNSGNFEMCVAWNYNWHNNYIGEKKV